MTGGGKEEEVTLMYVILLLRKLENQSLCFGDGYLSGLGFYVGMGCSGSKVDGLPLVIRCRERRDLIRAAADHRYGVAAAHVAYFNSMKNVGDALRRFVEEELILAATSSSSSTPTTTSSSGLTLHSLKEDEVEHEEEGEEEGEEEEQGQEDKEINEFPHRNKSKNKGKSKARSRSKIKGERQEDESGSGTSHVHHFHGGDESDSHFHSSDESDISHIHDLGDVGYDDMNIHHDPHPGPRPGPYSIGYGYGYRHVPPYGGFGIMDPAGQGPYPVQYPSYFGMNQPYQAWDGMHNTGMIFQNNNHIYYMRKSSPAVKTVIHRPEPVMEPVVNGYTNPYFGYPMQNEGFYGFQTGPPSIIPEKEKPTATPPPPSPKASAWDFLNPFDEYDNGYSGNEYRYGVGQEYVSSSPDSTEVRMREGIPDLEEETEHEAYKKAQKGKERREEGKRQYSVDGRTAETSSSGYRVISSHKRREDRQPSVSVSGSLYKRKEEQQPSDSVSGSSYKRREDREPSDSVSGSSYKQREDRQPSESVSRSSYKQREDQQPSDSVSRSTYKQREDQKPSDSVSRSSYKQRENRQPSDSASRSSDKRREERQHLGSVSGSSSVTFSHDKKYEESSSSEPVSLHNSSSEYSTKIMPVRKGIGSNSKKMPVPHYRGNADSTQTPHQHNADTSRTVTTEKSENGVYITEDDSSHETLVSLKSPVDMYVRKKGVSFEVDETTKSDIESSKASSFATFSINGSRDLREVVAEIRDEFATAYDNGKEVAVMLDVEKLPYQPNIIRVILSRMLYLISPSLSSSYPPSMRSIRLAAKTVKLAKSYFGDALKDIEVEPCNLVSTFEKLYAWEKKLYKEVKNEERLRIAYDKQFKRLKSLDQRGAESSKIDIARASIQNLLTRLNVSIKSIDAISGRIQKLRDEELHPQVSKLIYGMIRMWRLMLSCHQKQFQAIKESKLRALRAKTDSQKDSTLRATCNLEKELRLWCRHFNDWITTQKAYVESLNGWLTQCLDYKPEETPDGPVPFSPGQFGAPPIFIICHDWKQAMETISETSVSNAMNKFASSLRDLWEKQDEEQRQRLIADDLSEDFRNRLKNTTTPGGGGEALVTSENGGLELKMDIDIDTVQKRLKEERAKHKDAIKILNYAASNSVQGGLMPIFRALESFSMEALKAHEKVRLSV